MNKKSFYVFLDIDGVLYDSSWLKQEIDSGNIEVRNMQTFKPESIQALNYLLYKLEQKYNVDLVICSTWRCDMDKTVETLKRNGLNFNKSINSTTYMSNPKERGKEIMLYLIDKHSVNNNYLIIDDESFDYEKYFKKENIIKPSIYKLALSMGMVQKYFENNKQNEL